MIRSHSSWHSEDITRWSTDQSRYRKHLNKVRAHLPPALRRFVREFTLHDDRISEVQIVPGLPSGRDALVTVRLYRDGYIGTAALLVLHLVGIRGGVKKMPPDLDVMFFDAERLSPSVFRLSFALEEKKTWAIKFGDFHYYYHDYREKKADPVGTDNDRAAPGRV